MCEVTTATAMMIVSAATTAVAYVEADASAKKQQAAIDENTRLLYEGAQKQYEQINAASSQQMSERAMEARREQARLRVIAGESGALGGVSQDRIMNESEARLGTDMATLESNRKNQLDQVYQDAKAGRGSAVSQSASIRQPSLIGSGLQIVGAGVKNEANLNARGGTMFYDRNPAKGGINMPDDAPNRGGR